MAFTERTLAGINELIAELKQMITNGMTPARTVSWFYRDTAPIGWAICDGRTVTMNDGTTIVTPNLIDRYIVGKKTSDSIGRTIDAGLPNIEGKLISDDGKVPHSAYAAGYKNDESHRWEHGALYVDASDIPSNLTGIYDTNRDRNDGWLCFDASRSNAIYGNSDTVTPPSIGLLPCIKL